MMRSKKKAPQLVTRRNGIFKFPVTTETSSSALSSAVMAAMNAITDSVCLFITCRTCETLALKRLPGKDGLFLPTQGYEDQDVESVTKQILNSIDSSSSDWCSKPIPRSDLLIQVNKSSKSYSRVIVSSKLNKGICCKQINNPSIIWLKMESFGGNSTDRSSWGPEPGLLSLLSLKSSPFASDDQHYKRMFPKFIEVRINANVKDFMGSSSGRETGNMKRQLASAAGFTKLHLVNLYQEFHSHAFPSMFWSYASFKAYFVKCNWSFNKQDGHSKREIRRLYNSFRPYGQMYLTFADFVTGIACMSNRVKQAKQIGYERIERIFRFYDDDRKGHLSYPSMVQMRKDILRIQRQATSAESVAKHVKQDYKVLGIDVKDGILNHKSDHPAQVSQQQLIQGISKFSDTGLRGFSILYRSNFDFVQKRLYASSGNQANGGSRCDKHSEKVTFELDPHVYVMGRDRRLIRKEESEVMPDVTVSDAFFRQTEQLISKDNIANQILDLVHHHAKLIEQKVGLSKETCSDPEFNNYADWVSVDQNVQKRKRDMIRKLCQKAKSIFVNGSRIPKTTSPCIVFGDLHGNLSNLLTYESNFWPSLPIVTGNYVFLGDFVDRGKQSIEVFLYVLALKCLLPDKFMILRGNHETKQIHKNYGFEKECRRKFGDNKYHEMYHILCDVMASIPVAGLIDEQLFCCHGGIPLSESSIKNLKKMPSTLHEADQQYPAANEIMWSDPSEHKDMAEMAGFISSPATFIPNIKRSTGYYFDEEALAKFNQINGTTHLLRGHEMVKAGFLVQFSGKVVTVFSSSSYQSNRNTAAVLLIQDGMITPIQVDT